MPLYIMDSDAASESSLSFDDPIDSCEDNDDSTEKCYFGDCSFELPECFCSEEEVFKEVLSESTWNSVMNSSHADRLKKLLPNFEEDNIGSEICMEKEINNTLTKLLDGENFKFGNPIESFFNRLKDGFLSSEVTEVSKSLHNAYYREYKYQQQQYSFHLFRDILISRKKLLDTAYTLPPSQVVKMQQFTAKPKDATLSERTRLRYFSTLQDLREETGDTYTSSEDENYPESGPPKVTRKQKKHMQYLEASLNPDMSPIMATTAYPPGFPGSGHFLNHCIDMFEVSEERYREMLLSHREKVLQDPDHRENTVSKIEWKDVIAHSGFSKRFSSKSFEDLSKKKLKTDFTEWSSFPKAETPSLDSEHSSTSLKIFQQEDSALADDVEDDADTPLKNSQDFDVLTELVLMEVKEEAEAADNRLDSPHSEIVKVPTSFFALLRDLFCESVEQKLSAPKLEDRVRTFQETATAVLYDWLNIQESWADLVSSALKFLAGDLMGILPESFVPFLDYKEKQQQWQWIGSGRDSEEQLYYLCQQWLDNKDDISLEILETLQGSPPPPRVTTVWTVRATNEEEKKLYREQECVRYQNPHKAFTFKVHGYEAVVGPVKGVYGKESGINKAREHSLLVSDRPPFVTILSLVRDSAARLPNGEGTRADICELLKDSQYLSPANEQQIHTVVSGALDRLHYEKDPCVKYDVNRKLWIYLHRNRTEEEFERIHQAQAAAAKARKAVQKTKIIKPKNKDASRTSAATLEGSVAVLNVDIASGTNVSSTNSSHSPRSSASPRTQNSPKQINFSHSRHVMRSISIPSQATPKVGHSGLENPNTKKLDFHQNSSSNIGHIDVMEDDLSNYAQPTVSSVSSQTQEFHSSRSPSQNSSQSLPSPKTVLANINSVQLTSTAPLHCTSISQVTSSNFISSPIRGVLSVDMKPSSPSFVGQPPVLQPVLSQDLEGAPFSYASTSTPTPLLQSATSTTSKSTNSCMPCLQNPKAVTSFQTIVIKQDPNMRTMGNVSSLPLLSVEELSSDPNALNAGSVVARLVQGSQYLSLGNLVANANAQASMKASVGSRPNFKIHGGNLCQQMLSTSTINLVSSSPIPSIIDARVSKAENKTDQSTGTDPIMVSSPSSSSYTNPLSATGRAFQSINRKDVCVSTNEKSDLLSSADNRTHTPTVCSVTLNSTHTVPSNEHSLRVSGKDQPLILATKESLKSLPPAYLMTTSIPTSAVNTAHGVRSTSPFNVRTVQGIKVIPVPQTTAGNKSLQNPPMLARIFTPTTGMSLRPAIAAELMQSCQMKSSSSVNIMQGIRTTQSVSATKPSTISSPQELSNSQPFIIQVQAPKLVEEELDIKKPS